MKLLRTILLIFPLFPLALVSVQREQLIVKEEIISQNIDDFDCHSSSIIEIDSVLCAVWKGGPGKGKSNIDLKQNVGIWFSRCENGIWSEPKQIVQIPNSVCWNPILVQHPNGELLLFFRIGMHPRHTVSMYKYSSDGGLSWSPEVMLPAGIGGPTRAKPIFDAAGNMLCGSSVEVGASEDKFKGTACWVEVFSNGQWSKYGPIEIPGKQFGCIEPVLFWGENGILKMICRDRSNRIGLQGWVWSAESKDSGKTWSKLQMTGLPNPDSGIEAVAMNTREEVLLIYNHSHTQRAPLSLALSKDYGASWTPILDIEKESGEFPSAALDLQGYIHVTYAWCPPGRTQRVIKHIIIDYRL